MCVSVLRVFPEVLLFTVTQRLILGRANIVHLNINLCKLSDFTDDLAVDYQFTFNLSKKEDKHLSAINFRNAPVKPDVDADFSITCSAHARMNLTVRTRSDPAERTLISDVNCTNFRYK